MWGSSSSTSGSSRTRAVLTGTIANQAPIAGGHSRSTVRPPHRPGEIDFEAELVIIQVRTAGPTRELFRELRLAVGRADPELPLSSIVDLRGAVTASLGETKTISYLVSVFAGLALVLAAIGLYGLVAFGLSQRVREMGIRLALGARPESLVRMTLRRGLVTAGIGITVGAGLLLFGTAALAAWIPARRAARLDAVISLRHD